MLGAGVSSVGVKRIAVSGFGERIERIVGNGLHASCAASCWITGADCGPPIAMCADCRERIARKLRRELLDHRGGLRTADRDVCGARRTGNDLLRTRRHGVLGVQT